MNEFDITSQNNPNHKLYVEIKNKDLIIRKVLCDVYLPNSYKELATILCYPTSEQYEKLIKLFDFSIKGWVKDNNNKIIKIEANEAYFAGSNKINWGSNICDITFKTRIMDLTVTTNYEKDASEKELKIITHSFWVTPCHILTPQIKDHNISFKIFNNIELQFKTYKRGNDENINKELFAEYQIVGNSIDIKEELFHIDNFLLIVSLAMRKRCFCIGWEIYESNKMINHYRNNFSRDRIKNDSFSSDELIDYSNFKEFIDIAYNKYESINNKNLVRNVIYILSYGMSSTIEESYKSLFTAVESLIILFQKEMGSSHEIMGDDWGDFKKELKEFIKCKSILSGSSRKQKGKRKLVYEKIGELYRISFNESKNRFCEYFNIDISDLWPLTDNKSGHSLNKIRNILVHGDTFEESKYIALMNATIHLQWIAERFLLGIFGWPVEKSKVSKDILSNTFYPYKNKEKYIKIISGL